MFGTNYLNVYINPSLVPPVAKCSQNAKTSIGIMISVVLISLQVNSFSDCVTML